MKHLKKKPILDAKENELLAVLTKKYEKLITPGPFEKGLKYIGDGLNKITPKPVRDKICELYETKIFKQVLEVAAKGFTILQNYAAKMTINENKILENLKKEKLEIKKYNEICCLRSYKIQEAVNKKFLENLSFAAIEGFATGCPGFSGIPFNIALSFFLYFRATQTIAMYYGYDVKNDPNELQIASSVTLMCLQPSIIKTDEGTIPALLGKMMAAANLTSLKNSLLKSSYTEMAEKGGIGLLYVKLRALANKAAQNALNKAGKGGLEGSIFRQMLEQIGKLLPKNTAQKSIPLIGGFLGGLTDVYFMNKILIGANIVYHKRFLVEKKIRIKSLKNKLICKTARTKNTKKNEKY